MKADRWRGVSPADRSFTEAKPKAVLAYIIGKPFQGAATKLVTAINFFYVFECSFRYNSDLTGFQIKVELINAQLNVQALPCFSPPKSMSPPRLSMYKAKAAKIMNPTTNFHIFFS